MKGPRPASWIQQIPPYVPGTSKDAITARYGITNPIKLASNENPLGPSPLALAALEGLSAKMHLYPDPDAAGLRKAAADFFKCRPDRIITGNGSDEVLDFLCRAYLEPGSEVLIPGCTFSYYRIASLACGATIRTTAMKDHAIDADDILARTTPETKIVFVANPNNPTGTCLGQADITRLADGVPQGTLLVIDEAYGAFARQKDFRSAVALIDSHRNIAVTATLSKSHGLAGLRVGFCLAHESIIANLSRIKQPFNMNIAALKAGEAALSDYAFLDRTLTLTWEGIDYLTAEFERLGLSWIPSQTNFVPVAVGERYEQIYEELLKKGIITRSMKSFGMEGYLRVTVGLPEENRAFIKALEEAL